MMRIRLIMVMLFFTNIVWASQVTPLDKVVAVVNKEVVTESALNQEINTLTQEATLRHMPLPDKAVLRKKVLDRLVNQKLMMDIAKNNHIEIEPKELNKTISNIATKNHLTLATLKSAVLKTGVTWEQYQTKIKEEMLMSRISSAAITEKITVSDKEINQALSNIQKQSKPSSPIVYRIKDIYLPVESVATTAEKSAVKAKALQLVHQAQKGVTLSTLIKSTSFEEKDLGYRRLTELPDIFVSAVKTMQLGEVKGPVLAHNGYHILQLVDKQGGGFQSLPIAQQREMIRERLLDEKYQEKVTLWLQKVKRNAYVKYMG
jgi:peptidyl-prolyl cis-trans isomerase SurA